MRTNTTKAKLQEGKVVFGAIVTRYAPDMVEIFGALGYDFVMIDCEHGPADLDQVEHMVRAAESFGLLPSPAFRTTPITPSSGFSTEVSRG